jgi:hypothetical protein
MGRTKKHNVKNKSTFYSFIFHVTLLLIFSLAYNANNISKEVVLSLSFGKKVEQEEIAVVDFIEPEISEEIFEEPEEQKELEITEDNIERINIVLDEDDLDYDSNTQEEDLNRSIDSSNLFQTSVDSFGDNALIGSSSNLSGDGDGEILKRLSRAGANTGDVQVSISWNNRNDIDLWVQSNIHRVEERIGWSSRVGSHTYGYLDIDRNAEHFLLTNEPVENIFWTKERIKYGRYSVHLNYYKVWDSFIPTKVNIRIKINNKIINKQANITYEGQWIKICDFVVNKTTFE